jgi:hypothetical protein
MQQDSQDDRMHMPSLPTRDDHFTTVGLRHAAWIGWHYETESDPQTTR